MTENQIGIMMIWGAMVLGAVVFTVWIYWSVKRQGLI